MPEIRNGKALLCAALGLLAAVIAIRDYVEYGRLALYGITAQASITKVETPRRGRVRSTMATTVRVSYAFTTVDGRTHSGRGQVPWEVIEDAGARNTIAVRYFEQNPDDSIPDYGYGLYVAVVATVISAACASYARTTYRSEGVGAGVR
jgi:hypothetical protein